jgi:hypothetical protein
MQSWPITSYYNRSSFPASFFSWSSMSLSYRESKWSEALLNTLIVNYTSFIASNQSLHSIFLNLFFISRCGTELSHHFLLVLFRMCPTTKKHKERPTTKKYKQRPTTKKYKQRLFRRQQPPGVSLVQNFSLSQIFLHLLIGYLPTLTISNRSKS